MGTNQAWGISGVVGRSRDDQICYVKDASGWKIGGYIGGDDSQ